MNKVFSIAIDGPSGAGKSTIAKKLANELDIMYLDTGALFRAVAYQALKLKVDPNDLEAVTEFIPEVELEINFVNKEQRVSINEKDVTDFIRTEEVSIAASDISVHPIIRNFILEKERELASKESFVLDGRDIGTVVLPKAEVKIFLSASPEIRAKRRYKDLEKQSDDEVEYQQVLADILKRDKQDSSRKTAPTKKAKDAVFLDSSNLTLAETLAQVKKIVKEKLLKNQGCYENDK
ncbi:MAG: (d)CMP kinase [Clostridiaceae bacterium]|nr:(d)CMP kinase [Clostridiaceae bacterium]